MCNSRLVQEFVQTLSKKFLKNIQTKNAVFWNRSGLLRLAESGDAEWIKSMRDQLCVGNINYLPNLIQGAAQGGHLKLTRQYIKEYETQGSPSDLNSYIFAAEGTALRGDADMMRQICEEFIARNPSDYIIEQFFQRSIKLAAERGNVLVMQTIFAMMTPMFAGHSMTWQEMLMPAVRASLNERRYPVTKRLLECGASLHHVAKWIVDVLTHSAHAHYDIPKLFKMFESHGLCYKISLSIDESHPGTPINVTNIFFKTFSLHDLTHELVIHFIFNKPLVTFLVLWNILKEKFSASQDTLIIIATVLSLPSNSNLSTRELGRDEILTLKAKIENRITSSAINKKSDAGLIAVSSRLFHHNNMQSVRSLLSLKSERKMKKSRLKGTCSAMGMADSPYTGKEGTTKAAPRN